MSATIIDGSAVAARLRAETAQDVEKMVAEHGVRPGLATVLIGDNPASQSYVRMKQKACAEVGIQSFGYDLPATTSQQEAEALVRELNANPAIHGILVQLPLPDHLKEEPILHAISLEKDVDGFHPVNIGRLAMKGRDPLFIPCTPYGDIVLLEVDSA